MRSNEGAQIGGGWFAATDLLAEKGPLATLPRGVTFKASFSRLFPSCVSAFFLAKFVVGSLLKKRIPTALTFHFDFLQHSSLPKEKAGR
jgi:hypothetical protein